jgi:hypothetical protein
MAIQRIPGQMLEADLVRSSNLTFQTNLLTVDVVNSRVGIGTAAPGAYKLDVNGSANIGNNLTVGGDTTITGNLTVSGDTTVINTTNITVEDNFILLNSGGSLGPDAGIMINREGLGNNAVFYFDEGTQKFKIVLSVSDGSTVTNITDSSFADFQAGDIAANKLSTDGIDIEDNTITTTLSDSNLVLRTSGTGNVDTDGAKIINVGTPSSGTDAANKDYVDAQISGTTTLGDFNFSETTIQLQATNGDFRLDSTGTGNFVLVGTTGLVLPQGDTASRPSAQTGIIRYNTETGKYEVSQDGSTWTNLRTEQTAGQITKDVWVGDGSSTQFTLSTTPTNANNIIVYVDGVMQEPGYTYTLTGNVLAFNGSGPGDSTTEAPHANARVIVMQGFADA